MAKVVFLQNIWHEQLGIEYLAASLKARGVDSILLIGREEKDFLPVLEREKPTLVAFSSTTGAHRWALRMARGIKRALGLPTVMGGAHPTFFPEALAEEGLDMIVRGEGEEALCELVEAIDTGKNLARVRNVWAKVDGRIECNPPRPLIKNLDALPFPDRGLFDGYKIFRNDTVRPILASRGCPYDCSYCFNASYRELYAGAGKSVRFRSAENVVAEARDLAARYHLRLINFVDDLFGLNRRWLLDFLDRYEWEVGIPFLCNSRWEFLDEEVARALKEANCWAVQLGIESGNESIRESLHRGRISNTQIAEKARLLKGFGLRFRTYNVLGLPGEPWEKAFATVDLNVAIGTNFPYVALFQPYPGTALGDEALKEGLVQAADVRSLPVTFHKRSVLARGDMGKIENLHKLFTVAVRLPLLKGFVRWLTRLPGNPVFEIVFLVSTGVTYMALTRRRIRDAFRLGFGNLRYYLEV